MEWSPALTSSALSASTSFPMAPPTQVVSTSDSSSYLSQQDVRSVHISFAVITLLYIPFILVNNNLVLCSTVLFRQLHTPNNLMMASLAVADLIMGVYCIPIYALSYIPRTQHLVKSSGRMACLSWFASIELGGAGSLKSLLLISADRFLAVVYPLHYHRIMTMRNTALVIAGLWLYVIIMTVVPFFGWNNYNATIQDPNIRCNYYLTLPGGYVIWASFFTIAFSIFIAFVLNVKIFYTVYQQQRSIQRYKHLWSSTQIKRFRERVQTVRITGVLFLLFIIFWLPYVLVAPLKYTKFPPKDVEIIKVIVQLLYFLNSVVNAPIYALMRTEYKIAYYLLLTTPVWRWSHIRSRSLTVQSSNASPQGDGAVSGEVHEMTSRGHTPSRSITPNIPNSLSPNGGVASGCGAAGRSSGCPTPCCQTACQETTPSVTILSTSAFPGNGNVLVDCSQTTIQETHLEIYDMGNHGDGVPWYPRHVCSQTVSGDKSAPLKKETEVVVQDNTSTVQDKVSPNTQTFLTIIEDESTTGAQSPSTMETIVTDSVDTGHQVTTASPFTGQDGQIPLEHVRASSKASTDITFTSIATPLLSPSTSFTPTDPSCCVSSPSSRYSTIPSTSPQPPPNSDTAQNVMDNSQGKFVSITSIPCALESSMTSGFETSDQGALTVGGGENVQPPANIITVTVVDTDTMDSLVQT